MEVSISRFRWWIEFAFGAAGRTLHGWAYSGYIACSALLCVAKRDRSGECVRRVH